MRLDPRPLRNISHPFIDSIYLKKEFCAREGEKGKDILVIHGKRNGDHKTKREQESSLLSFLADLDLIKDEVEKKAGKFSRIDIRCH
jgi:hypothetical protein